MKKGWENTTLGKVCPITNRKAGEFVGERPYFATGSVGLEGELSDAKYVSFATRPSRAGCMPEAGDVGFARMKGTKKVILVNETLKGALFSTGFCFLAPRSDIDQQFLFYFVTSDDFQNEKNKAAGVGIMGGIKNADAAQIQIPIPPLSEQKRIVAILDKAFAAIAKAKANAEKNLKNARELFESYLQGVFANPGDGWEEKKLGEVAKVIGGFSFKSTDFKKQGRYQVIRMGNVRPGIIRPKERPVFIDDIDDNVLKRALLLPNDVIITQTGTKKKRDYGFTVIIDKKNYLLNQRISAIRFSKNFLPKFFLYFSWTILFKDQYFANETGTVGQGNVGISAITDARVTFPPLAQQRSIVQKLDTFSAETKKLEAIYQQKIADLDELKKTVLQKAFNGDLPEVKI